MASRIIGIDLGTTNSLVGAMDSGFPILFPNAEGRRLTPSAIHFPPDGSPPIVGAPALRLRAIHPARTVTSAKRFIGRRLRDLNPAESDIRYRLAEREGRICLDLPEAAHPIESVSSLVLAALKADAEKALGEPVSRAVITVPAYFNDAQRSATKKAGELAGLHVERIINEPTAAALAYGVALGRSSGLVAVFDFGGGTFDISLLELREGVMEVRATRGDTRLGGDDIDELVASRIVAALERQCPGAERDPALRVRVTEEAERAKIALSDRDHTEIIIPFAGGAEHFSMPLSRADLEEISRDLVARTAAPCRQAMADAGVNPSDIAEVILVGGQTRMPMVRGLVSDIFQREPNTSTNPDEAVALGAVLQAGILEGSLRSTVLLDVTPLSLGIETYGGVMNVIIPRNTTIPAKAGELFTNAADGQRAMQITVLQGEREMARDNWPLGQFDLAFDPGPRGTARVGVQFEIDADGILRVLARDTKTGHEKTVEIRAAVDLDSEKVEAMVASSIEHAFDDMSARRKAELSAKATTMLRAARKILDMPGIPLVPGEADTIRACLASLETAIASGTEATIKEACSALDRTSAPLAQRLVDAACEKALERKGVL